MGDDIVIFDKGVADRYKTLCSEIGVSINISKSIISEIGVAEYAKRTTMNGIDVSPLSFKEFISNNTLAGRVILVHRLTSLS